MSSRPSAPEMPSFSVDIGKVKVSTMVKCVLLKAPLKVNDEKEESKEHMEEIEIDTATTPAKSLVSKILGGGPVSFLGQYKDEGIVLMAQQQHQQQQQEPRIQQKMESWDRQEPPWNPHRLPPPLHELKVRGDILVLKVASANITETMLWNNEGLFTNYSLDDYIQFASRTNIPEHETASTDGEASIEDQGDNDDEDDDDDDDNTGNEEQPHLRLGTTTADNEEGEIFHMGDEEEIDEEDKAAMFNLVMNEVLRQYREENGRGPDTKELLEMRATIAKELDVQVAHVDAEQADWNKNAKDGTPAKDNAKTIAFHTEDKVLEYEPDPNEHNYHDEEYEEEGDQEGSDEDGTANRAQNDNDHDDDGDGDETQEPPSKRQRMEDSLGVDAEQEDSKPAAVTKDPVPEGTAHSGSKSDNAS